MARSIAIIQAEMDVEQSLQSGLNGLNSPSQVSIYILWKYIVSAAIFAHETLWDLFKIELEAVADSAIAGTDSWVKEQVLLFQYSYTVLLCFC